MRTRLLKWTCCCSPFISLTNQRASTAKRLPKAQRTWEWSAVAKVTAQTSQEQANSEFWPNKKRCLNCEKLSPSCCRAVTKLSPTLPSTPTLAATATMPTSLTSSTARVSQLSLNNTEWVSHWQDHAMIILRFDNNANFLILLCPVWNQE